MVVSGLDLGVIATILELRDNVADLVRGALINGVDIVGALLLELIGLGTAKTFL